MKKLKYSKINDGMRKNNVKQETKYGFVKKYEKKLRMESIFK